MKSMEIYGSFFNPSACPHRTPTGLQSNFKSKQSRPFKELAEGFISNTLMILELVLG